MLRIVCGSHAWYVRVMRKAQIRTVVQQDLGAPGHQKWQLDKWNLKLKGCGLNKKSIYCRLPSYIHDIHSDIALT